MGNTVSLDIIAVDSASNILRNIAGEFGALGAAAAAGIGMATAAFSSLLKAGGEEQDSMARFNSLIDSSPLASYKDEMIKLADATALKTRYDQDSILAAEGQLAIYTAISEQVFPAALDATINLATYMQTDAPAAAKTLGRALEDIGNNSLNLLMRQRLLTKEQVETAQAMITNSGSSAAYKYELDNVSDSVREQVEALQAAGNYTEAYNLLWKNLGEAQQKTASEMRNTNGEAAAQQYVIDVLNGKIGNLAEDMGKTFPGQIEILQNKLGEFWDGQGDKTLSVLAPLVGWFNILADEALPFVSDALGTMDFYLNKAVTTFGLLMSGNVSVGDFFGGIGKSIQNIDWAGMGAGLISAGKDLVGGLLDGIIFFLEDFDWGAVGTTVTDAIRGLFTGASSVDVSPILDKLGRIGGDIMEILGKIDWGGVGTSVMTGLSRAFSSVRGWLANFFLNIDWKGISEGLSKGMDGIDWSAAGKAFGDGLKALGTILADNWNIAKDIIWNMLSKTDWGAILGSAAKGFADFVAGMVGGSNFQTALNQWGSFFDGLGKQASKLVDAAKKEIEKLKDAIGAKITELASDLKSKWDELAKGAKPFEDAINGLIKLVQDLIALLASIVIPGAPAPASGGGGGGEGNSSGADFIVPPGYPNDSYPMRVESGEHVVVTPANKVGAGGQPTQQTNNNGSTFHINTLHIHLDEGNTNVAGLMAAIGASM